MPRSNDTSSVYVKMGQLSVSVLFRQLPKATNSVVAALCWLGMVGMCVSYSIRPAPEENGLCEEEDFNKDQLETSCG